MDWLVSFAKFSNLTYLIASLKNKKGSQFISTSNNDQLTVPSVLRREKQQMDQSELVAEFVHTMTNLVSDPE